MRLITRLSPVWSAMEPFPVLRPASTGSAPQELKWDGNQYVLKLTDTNGVLSKFNFTSSNSDVKVSTSGNTLTITSIKRLPGTCSYLQPRKFPQ